MPDEAPDPPTPLAPSGESTAAPSGSEASEDTSADKLFKTAFKLFLRSLVELVRPQLAARLDLDHAQALDPAQLPDFRKAGHVEPDLVVEAKARRGKPRLVVVHVEAEGTFRRQIDDRMMEYGLHLFLKNKKPVVSIAVFLSGGPAGVTIREVTSSAEEDGEEEWEAIRFRYLAFGLSKSLAEEYVDRPQPLAPALAALMRSKKWNRVEKKIRCFRAIAQAEDLDVSRRYVLARIVNTYLKLDEDEQRCYDAELRREPNKEVIEMVVTWEEALASRETIGETRGKLDATRESIALLAKSCNCEVSPDFEEKLNAIADLDRLHRILERIPHVNSVEKLDLD